MNEFKVERAEYGAVFSAVIDGETHSLGVTQELLDSAHLRKITEAVANSFVMAKYAEAFLATDNDKTRCEISIEMDRDRAKAASEFRAAYWLEFDGCAHDWVTTTAGGRTWTACSICEKDADKTQGE